MVARVSGLREETCRQKGGTKPTCTTTSIRGKNSAGTIGRLKSEGLAYMGRESNTPTLSVFLLLSSDSQK
nr:hypothetical protein Q903MT_gene315 [Picea sitchensis]